MDESAGGSSSSASGNEPLIDAAERLRQRRRQKILANQGSRLNKILGTEEATDSRKNHQQEKKDDPPDEDISQEWGFSRSGFPDGTVEVEEKVDNGVTIIYKKRKDSSGSHSHDEHLGGKRATSSASVAFERRSTPEATTRVSDNTSSPQGFFATQTDGSTLHPKISSTTCRIVLCILGIILPFCNARYLLVTFFSWEVAVFSINGLPEEESPSSLLVLVVALMGLKEPQLQRLKFFLKLINCLITDVSIFIVFSLIPQIMITNPTVSTIVV